MSEKKKKVFISGPMSGIKDYNKPAFDKAEEYLTQAGYSVFNPARMHFDDAWSHEEIMAIDLAALSKCDYILMLDKWHYSKGSTQEYNYAMATGIELMPTWCYMRCPLKPDASTKLCSNCKSHYEDSLELCKSCNDKSNWTPKDA